MMIRRVLNFEDLASKHAAVVRALYQCGISNVDHAITATEGLEMMEKAIAEGKPYDLVVTDMYFPVFPGDGDSPAGLYVIEELKNRQINVPIIVCSSARMVIPEVVGCIHYNYRRDLDEDMRELIEEIRGM